MKYLKNIFSLFLSLIIILSMCSLAVVNTSALTQGDVVSWMNSKNGTTINDGGTQCVAAFNSYLRLFGFSNPIGMYPVSGAKDIFNYNAPSGWQKISGSGNYQVGDVVIWDGSVGGGWGHVGMVYSTNNGVQIFDQNWVAKNVCGIHALSSTGAIRGVFRPPFSVNTFPGEEDTSWNVPVWKTANTKLNTYDSYGNQEANRWIDQGDNCYIEKVYKNGYAWVKYPSGSSERWAYTKADGFSLEKKSVVNDSIVDLGDSFSARIRHGGSGKLLTDINDNVALYEHQNDNIANQIWKFQKNANGSYKIVSSVSDVAMDLDNASDNDGTNIKLYSDYSTIAQNWFIHQSTDGLYYFRSECSQTRVFDLCGGATDNNTNVQLWTYNGTDAQKFRIDKCAEILNLGDEFKGFIMSTDCWKPIMQTDDNNVVLGTENTQNMKRSLWHFYRNKEAGYYTIYNYLNGKCLDVHNASDEDGANVQCFDQHDNPAQKWYILRSSDGAYTYMKAGCSSKNLDVENGSTEDGANIQLYTLNGTAAQKFTIYKLDETRDKISYNLVANQSDINVGDSVSIEITNAIYAIDYKLYIVNPDGSKDTIALDMNNNYIFSPTKTGKYIIFASVTSPVSSYTGSEIEKSLEISVNAKIVSGDVNSDDVVNMKDIVLLQQYLNNWDVDINTDASDVNNDDVINMKDIVLLQQYMNGWDVALQ